MCIHLVQGRKYALITLRQELYCRHCIPHTEAYADAALMEQIKVLIFVSPLMIMEHVLKFLR